MEFILLLAQDQAALEAAEKGLSLIEKVNAGGVPVISLLVALACAFGFYWQLKQNAKLRQDQVDKAEARENAKDAETKVRLGEQETLLREMLDRDRESQEAQLAAVQAVQGFTHALNEVKAELASLKRTEDDQTSRFKDLEEFLRRRFRDG